MEAWGWATFSMAAAYAEAHISPTLGPALAALCRAKPADPVTWLAHYLLEHKPAKKLVAAAQLRR